MSPIESPLPFDPANPLEHLAGISVLPRDVVLLSTPQPDISWSEACDIIARNDLAAFRRRPRDLRDYLLWKNGVEQNGGVLAHILEKMGGRWGVGKLQVESPKENSSVNLSFTNDNVCVLPNHFPYSFEPGIVHVVVWIRASSANADSAAEHARIEAYVVNTFCEGLGLARSRVAWFKNGTALQSVPQLQHFHVLLRDPPMDRLEQLYGTGGVPAVSSKTG